MPRPKKESAGEPKKRSRTGCWPCKARKVKCGEEKPACANCVKSGEQCDYSIRLNWGGRSRKDQDGTPSDGTFTFVATPTTTASHTKAPSNGQDHVFSAQHISAAPPPRPPSHHRPPPPNLYPATNGNGSALDPRLRLPQLPAYSPEAAHQQTAALPSISNVFEPTSHTTDRSKPTSAPADDDFRWSPQHSAKRVRLSSHRSHAQSEPSPLFAVPQYPAQAEPSPASTHVTTHSIGSIVNTPATPVSSITSGSPYATQPLSLHVHEPSDLRRLSVKSLLSDPSDDNEKHPPRFERMDSNKHRAYGYDHGLHDLDLPNNDDDHVLFPRSPDLRRASAAMSEVSNSSNEFDSKQIAFEPGGYYAQPVPIKIPRCLEPLPDELLRNQMNLLYFHHFINHTGRILVPHDCPDNPFRRVMPQMAVRNPQLLHLVLAFSASHRARLLDHPEPVTRIANWMTDVVPALRRALSEPSSPGVSDPRDPSSLAPLATALMLAAHEIICPSTLGVQIAWYRHLAIARQLIVAKGGLHHLAQQADGARDKAIFFLSRWFAYMDVLGSLSGSMQDQPLFGAYLEDGGGMWLVNRNDDEIYQIDCFFGFSGRCIALLAQVAALAGQCDKQRIDPITNQAKAGWAPPEDVKQEALELIKRFKASATTVYRGCTHTDPSEADQSKSEQDVEEICATNEAYHWAGLIHLLRRVLGHPSSSLEVQENVHKTIACLRQSENDRKVFMDRLKEVEVWGMPHVRRARELMQIVWDTGRPWETLVNGEFFG
ncbi:Serine/threonine protein kinase [Teratosphaeria destructans]|uniref:Serine/threonine protein kinase n=1 Tax=Teratosphaeria destructans TaxID=418781 RepID=A0A9W7SYS0_9PEZI|nr:Serine/threonine protein kinase [Teratosphaeria destructans]